MSTLSPATSRVGATARSRWQWAAGAEVLVLSALAVALLDPARRLLALWLDSYEYGHGPVVVLASAYLLWLRRDAFRAETPRPDLRGLVATAALMAAWFVSRTLGIVLGEQLVLVLLLLSVTYTVLGPRVTAVARLPVLYLIFAIPVWSEIGPTLQSYTAEVSTELARTLGVPIYLEGLYMTIPAGQFVVAETCSGLRYLLAALSLGGFYALLNLHTAWARMVLLLVCAALGVVFNWVRVVTIVLIGHHSQMQSPLVKDHIGFGWVLFLVAVVATLLAGRLLERLEGEPAPRPAPTPGPAPATRALLAAAAISAGLVLGPAFSADRVLRATDPVAPIALPARLDAGGWSRVALPDPPPWRPEFHDADAQLLARYQRDGQWVDVYVAYYAVQRQDAEVVNDRNILYDRDVWRRFAHEIVETRVAAADGLPMAEYWLRRREGRERRLMWRSYWVDGEFTVAPKTAKWLQLRGLLSDLL